jgi:ornithine cyclodeaminase
MKVKILTENELGQAVCIDNEAIAAIENGFSALAEDKAAKYLAPQAIQTAGVVGTGAQGRYQIQGLMCVRKFERLLAFDLDKERQAAYVREMEQVLQVPVSFRKEVISQNLVN